jgi:hypothetical protein
MRWPKTPKDNAPCTAIKADADEQMDLLDGLSIDLKRIVWEAPVPLDVRQVKQIQNAYAKSASERLIAAIKRDYPDWPDFNRVARPRGSM